jgi:uncharacterized membrane protein YphA (DoxX/SURF4 family)
MTIGVANVATIGTASTTFAGAAVLMSLGALAARVLLGAIFLQAGVQKLRHYEEWEGVVGNYRVLPFRLVPAFSRSVPVIELGLAATLWFGQGPMATAGATGSAAAAILLGFFSVAIGINLARGRSHIDCGCFQSALRQQLSLSLLVRNGLLILIALTAFSGAAGRSLPTLTLAMAACLGGVCFVLYLALNELVVRSRPTLTLPSLRRL